MIDLQGVPCLVLGGGGFIGVNLCRRLAAMGTQVRGFGHRSEFVDRIPSVIWTQGDFTDRIALARVVDGAEYVFHLIGGSIPETSNKDPVADLCASTVASLHLLDICRTCAVRKIVFVSSGGTVYGPGVPVPTPETAPTNPVSAYGISKIATEKYLSLYRYLHGLDYCILRVANPYGPFQNPNRRQGVIAALINRALHGKDLEIWGSGDVVRDFIHVDDVVEAIIAVCDYHGGSELFNVGSGSGRSIAQVAADVITVTQRSDAKVIHRPGRATDVPVSVLDIGLIQRETGWSPRMPWLEGLRATADWISQTYPPG